ncbi:MAG: hypothetical protein KAU35_02550 [candidate division Zixibacteria bacterium]|nr:hypothetical protein [candidate division Zixibacteria bacterium]
MMLIVYKIVSLVIFCCLYPFGRLRAARGSRLWQGRLGLINKVGPVSVWIHASSVGEVRVISYMVDYLRRANPSPKIHVSVMTPAGYETAAAQFGDAVTITYFPIDSTNVVRRTLDMIQPQLIVIAETEIWPNLIREAGRRRLPLIMINGRMSEKAFGRYRIFQTSLGRLLRRYERLFVKSQADADRYRFFGIAPARCEVAGDMKFDAPLPERCQEGVREIRRRAGFGVDDFLMVAGSTRNGEEAMMLDLLRTMSARYDKFRLIIAPRHIERAGEIGVLLRDRNIRYVLFGQSSGTDKEDYKRDNVSCVVVDRVGLLNDLYLAADIAFVGGTLVDVGGHNLLEPVWAGTPVLFGPHLDNVNEAADYILSRNYGARVQSADELTSLVENACSGKTAFAIKTETDLAGSATARAGTYILEKLTNVRTALEKDHQA